MTHVRDLTPEQQAALLTELKRGPTPQPMPVDKRAADMTDAERLEWLREHKRRFE